MGGTRAGRGNPERDGVVGDAAAYPGHHAPLLDRIVTYGEPDGIRAEVLGAWAEHRAAAAAEGRPLRRGAELRNAMTHVLNRLRGERLSAVAAGFLLVLIGASSTAFAFDPDLRQPVRVHLHIGLAAFVFGATLLRRPSGASPRSMAVVGLFMSTAGAHLLLVPIWIRPGDWLINAGAAFAVVTGIALSVHGVTGSLRRRRLAFDVFAVTALLLGAGNLESGDPFDGISFYTVFSIVSGLLLVMFTCSLLRLRGQRPEHPDRVLLRRSVGSGLNRPVDRGAFVPD